MGEAKELTLAELNHLTAKEIMGWTSDPGVYINGDETIRWEDWRPTTLWRDAGRVIDRMRELGWLVFDMYEENGCEFAFIMGLRATRSDPVRTFPLAITLAALAARTGERYSVKEE